MREYGSVAPQFWIGETGKALKKSGPEAVIVALYLMTSPHSNMLGFYYMPELYMAHETGLGIEGASKGLLRCIEGGFCSYDKASEVVWVHEMARFQVGDKLEAKDKRSKGVQNAYNAVPANAYLADFYDKYAVSFCMTEKRESKGKKEAPSKPLASQEQEQEQEQEQKKVKSTVELTAALQAEKSSAPQAADSDSDDAVSGNGKTQAENIEGIFDYWRKIMDSPKSLLDDKRKGVIRRALKAGYSPRDLCMAIKGCSLTPHNQGKNERGQAYLGIHVCLKDADQIDRFIANAKNPPVEQTAASKSQAVTDANKGLGGRLAALAAAKGMTGGGEPAEAPYTPPNDGMTFEME
jgi:hypothetical protein